MLGGGILYTPPAAFSGTDTFPVTITDTLGATVNGTVTVTVGVSPGSGGSTLNPPQVPVQPNGKPKIVFQGIPVRTYRVERSMNMTSWSHLGNVTVSPTGQVEYTDENPPQGSAFYRIARPRKIGNQQSSINNHQSILPMDTSSLRPCAACGFAVQTLPIGISRRWRQVGRPRRASPTIPPRTTSAFSAPPRFASTQIPFAHPLRSQRLPLAPHGQGDTEIAFP